MTNKYRSFFLNIIYLVLLVEIALNKNNINYEELIKTYQTTKENNIKIKNELENIEKKTIEYLLKLNEKDVDYLYLVKIKNLIEKTKKACTSIDETKEILIKENGGYDEKNKIKNPKWKRTKKTTLEKIYELLESSYRGNTQPDDSNKASAEGNKKSLDNNIINVEEGNKKSLDNNIINVEEGNKKSLDNNITNVEKGNKKSLRSIKLKRAKEHPKKNVKENKDNENKSTNKFTKKTLIELLSALEQRENDTLILALIEVYETEKKINKNKWDVNSFDLIIVPEKKIIKENETYKGQVYLVAKNKDNKIKANGVAVENNQILIPPQKNVVFDNNGLSRQELNVNYSFESPYNKNIISIDKKAEFFISNRKDIEGQHATIEALYKNCDNLYSVKNLDPETNKDISFTFEGGSFNIIKKENNRFSLVLVPNKDKCTLHVLNSKKEIDKIEFNVREIGKPKIEVIINNKVTAENSILESENINNILITSTANDNFKDKFPNESHYEIRNFVIYFCKKDKAFYTREVNGNSYKLNAEEKKQIKKADKLIIKTDSVKRLHIDPESKKETTKEKNIFSGGENFSRTFVLKSKNEDEDEEN